LRGARRKCVGGLTKWPEAAARPPRGPQGTLQKETTVTKVPADEMKLAREIARTERANAKFAAQTPAKQRVAIAKDVLLWLKMGKITAEQGTYLTLRDDKGRWMQEADEVNGYGCTACALGGIFAVACNRKPDGSALMRDSDDMRKALEPYFSAEQLVEIECAFEGFEMGHVTKQHPARLFNRKYANAAKRMTRVMDNIIANKGTFIP
jgi:hypothetical protein